MGMPWIVMCAQVGGEEQAKKGLISGDIFETKAEDGRTYYSYRTIASGEKVSTLRESETSGREGAIAKNPKMGGRVGFDTFHAMNPGSLHGMHRSMP